MRKIENGVVFESKYEIDDVLEVLGKYCEEHPDELLPPGNDSLSSIVDTLKDLAATWKW